MAVVATAGSFMKSQRYAKLCLLFEQACELEGSAQEILAGLPRRRSGLARRFGKAARVGRHVAAVSRGSFASSQKMA